MYLLLALSAILAVGSCHSNFTVTTEVTLEYEVKNYNSLGDDLTGKVVIGLFGESVPVASLNFKTICTGFKRPKVGLLTYRNSYCHRIVKDMLIQCGDIFDKEGHGTTSIYGEYFNDENFVISHNGGGIVSMANKGKDTNGSQFFITFGSGRFFDKKHVAFGKVIKGYQYLAAMNKMGAKDKTQKPTRPVRIADCTVEDVKDYELSEKDMKTDDLEGIVPSL